MKEEMRDIMNKFSEQQLSLNRLCRTNGFTSQKNRNDYELYEMGQTFTIQSFTALSCGELNHLENIAQLYLESNQENEVVLIRDTPFFGGKSTQTIQAFPD